MNDDDPFHSFDEMTAFLGLVALVLLAFVLLHFA